MKYAGLILCLVWTQTTAWELPVGSFSFEKVNDGVYVMHGPLTEPNKQNHGFMNNPAIVETSNGLVLIDPGSTYQVGKNVLAEIEKISQKPILAVFNTHIHGDHWLANHAISEKYPDVKIYGHPAMIEQATGDEGARWVRIMDQLTSGMAKDTKVVVPKNKIVHQQVINIDGEAFKAHSIVPAHTDTDIMLEHIGSKTVFLGDNGFVRRLGRFDDSSSILGSIKVLDYVSALNAKVYVPGHGKSGKKNKVITPFKSYLKMLKANVQKGFDDDLADYEIKDAAVKGFAKFRRWSGFTEQFGRHISKMYLEIEEL